MASRIEDLLRWTSKTMSKVPSPASEVRQSLLKSTPLREAYWASPSPCRQSLGCQRVNCCLAMLPKCSLRAEFALRSRGSLPVAMAMLKVKPSVVGRRDGAKSPFSSLESSPESCDVYAFKEKVVWLYHCLGGRSFTAGG